MSFANKHNAPAALFNYEIPETHQFAKPSHLVAEYGEDKVHKVKSIYINKKGKFGEEPVIVTDECLVNAPAHMVDAVKEIFQDEDSVNLINTGKVGFKFYEYTNKFGQQHSIVWVDIA